MAEKIEIGHEKQSSFTIGTPSTGGAVKVYFDAHLDKADEIYLLVDFAIDLHRRAKHAHKSEEVRESGY